MEAKPISRRPKKNIFCCEIHQGHVKEIFMDTTRQNNVQHIARTSCKVLFPRQASIFNIHLYTILVLISVKQM